MSVRLTDSTAVLALWWIALGLTVLVIVPLTIYLLHRTLRASRQIRRLTHEALAAGGGIADHVGSLAALRGTVEKARVLPDHGSRLEERAARLEGVLAGRRGDASAEGPGSPPAGPASGALP